MDKMGLESPEIYKPKEETKTGDDLLQKDSVEN